MSDGRRFVVKGLLGEGGFGKVYLADLVSAGGFRKEVALKVLTASAPSQMDAASRLRDEARLLGLLRHRNIVAVDDLVRLPEGWGVVMEVVAGVDLRYLMSHLHALDRTVPPQAAADVAVGIARALDAAYNHRPSGGQPLRAVHRDIKPGNVRITAEGEVKVLDFGIARAEFQTRETVTGDDRFGSLAYMSPERVIGEPETTACDVYALGVVLWEMLCCSQRGRALLRRDLHDKQLVDMQEKLRPVAGAAELEPLVLRMVDFDPEARPAAAEVVAELRRLRPALTGPDLEELAGVEVPAVVRHLGALRAADVAELIPLSSAAPVNSTTPIDMGEHAPGPAEPAPPPTAPPPSPPPRRPMAGGDEGCCSRWPPPPRSGSWRSGGWASGSPLATCPRHKTMHGRPPRRRPPAPPHRPTTHPRRRPRARPCLQPRRHRRPRRRPLPRRPRGPPRPPTLHRAARRPRRRPPQRPRRPRTPPGSARSSSR
jgi:serine/threonine protein kinase